MSEQLAAGFARTFGSASVSTKVLDDAVTKAIWVSMPDGPDICVLVRPDDPTTLITCADYTFESVPLEDVEEFVEAIHSSRARIEVTGRLWRRITLHVPVGQTEFASSHTDHGGYDDWETALMRSKRVGP